MVLALLQTISIDNNQQNLLKATVHIVDGREGTLRPPQGLNAIP